MTKCAGVSSRRAPATFRPLARVAAARNKWYRKYLFLDRGCTVRMTQHSDYALRMLMYLALRPAGLSTVGEIADAYGLSRNHLLKVALRLRGLGVVATVRGRTGGIRLARPAQEINIGALLRATEEDFALVECMHPGGGACALTPACRLRTVLGEALSAYLEVLGRYSLADIAGNREALVPLLGLEMPAFAEG